jgi:hypothetical protein
MAVSLKSCIPALARVLDETSGALYERQRTLVREGLLDSTPGHGPGSGVRATPESIAILIISLLGSARLAEAGQRARDVAEASAVSEQKCSLTGASKFKDALTTILSDERLSWRIDEILARKGYVTIRYDGSRKYEEERGSQRSAFIFDVNEMTRAVRGVEYIASINASTLYEITKIVTDLLKEEPPR